MCTLISYCQWELTISENSNFYQEFYGVWFKKSAFSSKNSLILLIFCKRIMYMCKKIAHIKNISHGKSSYFLIIIQRFCPFSVELLSISTKICIQKVSILRKKIMFQQLIVNFADFQQNNHVFMQKNCVFKNHNLWGKIYVSTK